MSLLAVKEEVGGTAGGAATTRLLAVKEEVSCKSRWAPHVGEDPDGATNVGGDVLHADGRHQQNGHTKNCRRYLVASAEVASTIPRALRVR